jgi:hypothetical protein
LVGEVVDKEETLMEEIWSNCPSLAMDKGNPNREIIGRIWFPRMGNKKKPLDVSPLVRKPTCC